MRGHFRYLRFKNFPMTPRTLQCKVFWAFLSSSEHSGVSEDSQLPTFPSVGLHPHTWPKWGCDRDNFGTPFWESQQNVPFGCSLRDQPQRILCGGRWWLPPSPGRGESCVSKCPWQVPTQKGVSNAKLTSCGWFLDANSHEIS